MIKIYEAQMSSLVRPDATVWHTAERKGNCTHRRITECNFSVAGAIAYTWRCTDCGQRIHPNQLNFTKPEGYQL